MSPIRWAILGCGNVTEVKSGPGFQKADNSQLVAVMHRDAAKAADYALRHNVPRWYDNADALLADPSVDAVYIATPPGTHEMYAHKVLAAGKPCYLEKPMTRNAAEAQRLVNAFAARSIPLFVAYYRRALPRFLKVRDLLPLLGPVTTISYRYADTQMSQPLPPGTPLPWRLNPEHAGGGLFLDLGSHALDLLDFFFGPLTLNVATVENRRHHYAVEDQVSFTFQTSTGAAGVASWSFTALPVDQFVFLGPRGRLTFSCFGNDPLLLQLHDCPGPQSFSLPNPPHVAQPLIQTIINDLVFKTPAPSTGVSALRTQALMDQVLNAYYHGREDGFWSRFPT